MKALIRKFIGACLLAAAALPAAAQTNDGLQLDLALHGVRSGFTPGAFARIDDDLRGAFEAMKQRIDAEVENAPWDVALRAARCNAISNFAYTLEYVAWADEVFTEYDECVNALETQFPEHAEVVLLRLSALGYQEQIQFAAPLLDRLDRARWTKGQQARLYTALAIAADFLGDANAGVYAARALNADANADTRLIYAVHAHFNGNTDAVRQALLSPAERIEDDDLWQLAGRLPLLSEIGEHDAVVAIHDRLRGTDVYYAHRDAADALIAVGEIERARDELALYEEFEPWDNVDEFERFSFEYRHGTPEQALAAYNAWRDLGWQEDFLGTNRLALQARDFSLPWQPRDWLFLAGIVIACACLALAAALPISAVHYRGLILRARRNLPYPAGEWQLRHAWLALFILGLTTVAALYFAGPMLLMSAEEEPFATSGSATQIAKIALVESTLTLLFLMPLARYAIRTQGNIWVKHWTLGRAVLTGAAVALVLRIPFFLFSGALFELDISDFTDSALMQMLTALRETYGIAAAYWMVAVLAPVVEEFVFRGVLLRAFSRHVATTTANTFQAMLFAAAHMNLQQAPFLFLVGFAAGVLANRSGGLAAPIAMHAIFNLVLAIFFF